MKRPTVQVVVLLAAMILACSAFAQTLPSSMRLIVPFAPGGPVDFVGRVLGDGLRAQLKNVVIVENRPGANGALGVATLKQSAADGASLLVVSSGMITFSPHFEKNLPYDPAKDLVPVVNVAYSDVGFVVANNVSASNLREFVAMARSASKPLAIGSAGTGNITHAYLELFKHVTKVELVHVPYKGSTPALADILGGQIAGMFMTLAQALPSAKAGKAKVLAVVGRRSAIAPEIPTVTEQGFLGIEILPWFGVMAPEGTSVETRSALASATRRAIETEEIKARLLAAGFTPWFLAGDDFTRMIQSESDAWRKLIRDRNLRGD